MIYNIYQEIAKNLKLVRDVDVYIEDKPEEAKLPLFLIHISKQDYSYGINKRQKNEISVDILYFPKEKEGLMKECLELTEDLFKKFSLDNYRISNRSSNIVDKVAHFMFKLKYSVYKEEIGSKIKNIEKINNVDDIKGEK